MDSKCEYEILNEATAVEYARNHPSLKELFAKDEPLTCKEIGDGNLNLIFSVWASRDPSRAILIKQAPPYVRRYRDYKLTPKRMLFEALYYEVCSNLCPEFIPHFYAYDEQLALVIMENLNQHIVLRKGLIARERYPKLAQDMGHFLATMLYSTSDFHLSSLEKKREVKRFINPELCQVTERAIFTRAYLDDEMNRWNRFLDPLVFAMRDDQELKMHVMELKYDFMTKAQALLHGDLHTGSVMVNQNDTRVIDPEFAFYGPMGFDIGLLLGGYILNYAAQEVRIADPEERASYQNYLLDLVRDTWKIFAQEFETMWLQERQETIPMSFHRRFMLGLLRDTAGFGGCKIIRRIISAARSEDMDGIEDAHEQARAMSLGLQIGQRLIMEREDVNDIEDVLHIVRTSQPLYPFAKVSSYGKC